MINYIYHDIHILLHIPGSLLGELKYDESCAIDNPLLSPFVGPLLLFTVIVLGPSDLICRSLRDLFERGHLRCRVGGLDTFRWRRRLTNRSRQEEVVSEATVIKALEREGTRNACCLI